MHKNNVKPRMCLALLSAALMAMMLPTMTVSSHQLSCTDVIFKLAPCLGYITGNTSSPSQQCCTEFASAVKSSSECLCQVLKGGSSNTLGSNVELNQTQALALPKACHVQTPPVSRCNAKSSNSSEHGNSSKTLPQGDNGSLSDGTSREFSFTLLSFLYVVSYITFYTIY